MKTSKNLYWILVLSLAYLIFSISKFEFKKFENSDWWLLVFIFSLQTSTTIAITRISYIRAENSPEYFGYKMEIHRLFEEQNENLSIVKKKWIKIIIEEYSVKNINHLYFIAHQMKFDNFEININDIKGSLLNDTYLDFLVNIGIVESKTNTRKINRSIKIAKYNYRSFKKYEKNFDYAERDFKNGSLVKSYDLASLKELGWLCSFLFSTTISIYGFIKWDNKIIFKLIVTALFIGINIIVSFVETKEHIQSHKEYWSDIKKALEEKNDVVSNNESNEI